MNNNKLLNIVCIGLFLLILISMHAWFFLWIDNYYLAVFECLLIAIMFLYYNKNKKKSSQSNIYTAAAIALACVGLLNRSSSIISIIGTFLIVSVMYLLMRFPTEAKIKILQFCTKWFSLLLLISVIAWLIHFVYPLPCIGNVHYLDGFIGESLNYIFFTQLPSDIRFKSVFLEPGHISTVASFFIIANRFDFKNKYVLLLSLEIIPTFGLAGYMLFIIGYFFYSIERVQVGSFLKRVIPVALLAGGAAMYYSSYNGGDNLFNQLILERMTYDEDRFIAGNDRSNDVVDMAFEKALGDGTIVTGLSKDEYQHVMNMGSKAAGAKPYMLEHGIIGTLFLFLGYFLISRRSLNKRWATLLFIIYAISFLQRAYFFWAGYYIPYICGMFIFNAMSKEKELSIRTIVSSNSYVGNTSFNK